MISPRRLISSLITTIVLCCGSFAQEAARPHRGATLNRNYLVSDIENINLQNGNVQLSIPLAALPPIAGGKLSWTISANYNSKIWDVLRIQDEPVEAPWMPYVVDAPSANGGWTIAGMYSIVFRNANDDFYRVQYTEASGLSQAERDLLNNHQWWKVLLVTPDGAEHELRPLDYSSYPGTQDFLRGYYNIIPSGSAMRYYSLDGSYLYAKISGNLDWTVYMPDGTRIIQTPDGVQRIQDTNGNKIKIFTDANGTHFQDEQTTNREIRVVYDPAANGGQGRYRIWYPTVTGIQHFIDVNMGTTIVQGKTHPVNDFDVVNETICQKTASLYTELQVVREIVFPQTEPGQPQRKFVFSYNSDTTQNITSSVNWSCSTYENYTRAASIGWGELSRMILPPGTIQTAAYTDYSFELDATHDLVFSTDDLANQGVAEKKLYHDGSSDTWTYAIGEAGGTVTSPDGSSLTETRYCATFGVPGCATDKAGLAYRVTRPFVMTERHWINLLFSGGESIKPGGVISFNPVVDYEYTTLLDVNNNPLEMSAKKFQYDFNGNVTQVTEYDWFDPALVSRDTQGVPTGVPGSATVLRVTNNSHYNQATGSTSTNVYAKRSLATVAPLILNAPKETTIGPSIVRLSYDGQPYDVAPTIGNLTTKEVWANLDAKWITTSNTYGLYGNLATATDARGKVTQFFYDDATHALPTRVVVDPQNGTGTQTTTTTYDYDTGLVTNQTDVNGQLLTISYTNHLLGAVDPFGRPGFTEAPSINIGGSNHKRRVTTTYLDSARQVIVEADLNAENDKLLKTRTTTDQLGRPVLTEQTEDGTNYTISSVNKYLDMGRVTLTSSARRSTASTTDSWTRVTKDNAGRVTEVATFGGAAQPAWSGTTGVFTGAVTMSYAANFTTVTDQAGKVRRSMVDALGRLQRVDEPDASGSLGSTTNPAQSTSYSYDVFGNLTTVTQGSQTRTFIYDSLSRLRTAVNPESGTISYQYDDNGNLIVKTDARTDPNDPTKKVSTHFEYDSLNRVTRRWYNGSNSVSATTHNSPSLPPGVGATSEAKFYYDSQSLPTGAPSYTRGSAIGRLVAQTYGTGSNGDYFAYDVLGRATLKIQQTGTVNYQLSAAYKLSGAIDTLTYPSGHTVTSTYDQAGRLTDLRGNLGDGATRTYATGIIYAPTGGLEKEQFGTTTPVYNKLFYNSRGQLAEIRASTSYTSPTDYDANRGAIINSYSSHCTGLCLGSSMPDNNGNLKQQDIQIPSVATRSQFYEYDSLNRLQSARELVSGAEQWKQQFIYDRWGNRLIDTAVTYGIGINNKAFTVDTVNNRLGVPGGQSGVMTYDAAGNLTNDTYTGAGNRTYDAENKITSAWGGNNQAQLYTYDASGQRIKRTVDGVETWQVYGFGGELLAEYSGSGAATTPPQKEYGYRNGQLLVTASAPSRVNVAASANGGTATASETHSAPYAPNGAINGDRKLYTNNAWANATATYPQWLQVDFNGSKVIDEVDVFSIQDNPSSPSEPTLSMTFSNYGVTAFEVQYWNGSSWLTVPNGQITGNNKVWKQITFSPITTNKIKVVINSTADGFSRLAEVEAWGTAVPTPRANVAASANGGTATASETHSAPYAPNGAINGDRKLYTNNAWANATATYPQWLQVDFNGSKLIDEIDVFSVQDNFSSPSEPTLSMTFNNYGVTAFEVQYWNGSSWSTVPNGQVTGNNKVWKQITFSPITTNKIKVVINSTADGFSRLAEVEAWGVPASAAADLRWFITDHLGTPRMVIDESGALANMKRHDYLPFGEELVTPTGGRSAAQGYTGGDGVRQQFTQKERDIETGLDYFLARYYSSTQGRFTSVDPENHQAMLDLTDPQSWNAYSYVNSNPLARVDPDGRGFFNKLKNWLLWDVWGEDDDVKRQEQKRREDLLRYADPDGGVVIQSPVTGQDVRVYPREMNRVNVWLWSDAMYYWQQNGGGYHQLSPERWANVVDTRSLGAMRRLQYEASPKHGSTARGNVSAAPRNGQNALDNSVQVKSTSPRRVGVDYKGREFVVFDQTSPGKFHGHVRTWQQLTQEMKNALIKSGMVNSNGKIQ